MSYNQNQDRNIAKRSTGFFQELTDRFRLISRLMMDSRVNPLIKLLPVGALAYAIWPIDVPGPIDDAFILWLGTTLFVQLCPPDIVDEHLHNIQQRASAAAGPTQSAASFKASDEVVDGEFFEADPNSTKSKTPR